MLFLTKEKGFRWTRSPLGAFKGYFQFLSDPGGTVYREADALAQMSGIRDLPALVHFLQTVDGVFSLILTPEGPEGPITLFAVDRARSMPLYYDVDGMILSDSSEKIRQVLGIEAGDVDVPSGFEMTVSCYVTGERSIYKRIRQLNGGMAGCLYDSGIQTETWYHHTAVCREGDISEYKRRLSNASDAVFRRLKKAVADRPIILSLSGGYDSRFVACMLKKHGFQDVSCYSYGRRDSFEITQSRKNAEALGFRWTFVEYTEKDILDILSPENEPYFAYCNEHDYTIYLQNYIAVKRLTESGWFKPNSVMITGLCGDMPTGQYILPPDRMEEKMFCAEGCAAYLCGVEYGSIRNSCTEQLLALMWERIDALPVAVHDYQTFWQAVDCICTLDVHSRAYLHMNRVHEFFGYEWLLPYWSEELLNTWYSIPAQLRAKQSLYQDWLLNDVCGPFGLGDKKNTGGFSHSLAHDLAIRFAGGAIHLVGDIIVNATLRAGLTLRRGLDVNHFASLEAPLFQRLRYRGKINYCRSSCVNLLARYVMETRYGTDAMRKICRYL